MKKTKLLLSLAMMCLSIAVLCFGVLAATSVTYSISGTISYEVTDVFVKINTSVYGIAEQQSKADVIATVKEMESKSQADTLTINSKTYTRTQTMVEYDSSNATTDPATHTAQTSDSKGVEIVYGTYYTYYIVINIQNLSSSKNVNAVLTDKTTAELNSIKTTNLYQNNISSTETKNIVIAYSIKDKTSSVNSAAISYSLKVSYDLYTDPITFTNDITNKGYFISLGTYSSSPIQWKLVSLDGVNKYNYTDGTDNLEARYLSGAMFAQDTEFNYDVAFDTAKGNNYFESSIRTYVNQFSTWGLDDSNDLSFIKKRNITRVGYDIGYYYDGTTSDYFWLLSAQEAQEIGDWKEGERVYWLRTPTANVKGRVERMVCEGGGKYWIGYQGIPTDTEYGHVRAAFQLA